MECVFIHALLKASLPKRALARFSGSASAFLIWEFFITLDDEVKYIWQKPNNAWIKWLYLLARYFPLATQISSRIVEALIVLQYRVDIHVVHNWYICQVLVAAITVMALEIIMMARVYALYNQPVWMKFLFILCLLSEIVIIVYGMTQTIPGPGFLPSDIMRHVPGSFVYFGIAALVVQVSVLLLTLVKYVTGQRYRVPVARLMMRDGTFIFFLLAIFSIVLVVYAVYNVAIAAPGCAWLISAVSCVSCRSIINMQRLSITRRLGETTSVQLTTLYPNEQSSYNN